MAAAFNRVVIAQMLLAVIAGLALLPWSPAASVSAGYGAAVAAANTWLHYRATHNASKCPDLLYVFVFAGLGWRVLATLGLFGLGFLLGLKPMPALAVFAMGQFAFAWGLRKMYRKLL